MVKDFTTIARADSMMIIGRDHLEAHEGKMGHVHKIIALSKLKMEQLSVSQQKS